jgi:ribonucleoside-diphosphate reductase alpha chain
MNHLNPKDCISFNTQHWVNFNVINIDNAMELFDVNRIRNALIWACSGYEKIIEKDLILQEFTKNIFDGISKQELADALILAASTFIERDPAYGHVAARLLFKKIYKQVTNKSVIQSDVDHVYTHAFIDGIKKGVSYTIFSEQLLEFNLENLALSLVPERDNLVDYMGMRTLYERYFMRDIKGNLFELPQSFLMRIAMGLALNEDDKNARAIEFYTLLSLLRYMPSTPTLLHAGLRRPQLSSCFLGTVNDDLHHIFKCIGDHAQLSKWSGGVAYDWSNIRATGAMVKSIKTESQGVVPFLKIANDTTAAINRSGKRRGASVVYLETWHLEIEDFLDLRRNTGDDRRRTHDMSTANWIPDLFMKRVQADEQWTLFSPHDVPDLHHLYGKAFEIRYMEYEQKALEGAFEQYKVITAKELWRKMITRLFETGHPWLTFKDACNIRSPQDHVGVVHCSNLCTEITLNNSEDETAVCNLGSINLPQHISNGVLDKELLAQTVRTGIRMLDNVVDINFYPTPETKNANMRHRPVGLGLMGFQDMLYKYDLTFEDAQTSELTDEVMEFIAYHAILASSNLAGERGAYQSYKGSKWDRDIFPQDTLDLLEQERGIKIAVKRSGTLDWKPVRDHVRKYGMRNSNTMAIAPTATISNISGCFPCIEPIYKNLYVKANMSGEFTVVNTYLIEDLKKLNLWNQDMLDQLKYYDGSVQMIDAIPQHLKDKYKEAFEIDPLVLIQLTALRGKWIDQSQSHNIFMQGVSGKKLSEVYMAGWKLGLKTFYYLRSLGASQIEKSTLDAKKFGFTQKRTYGASANVKSDLAHKSCSIEDQDCESCQ